jgi:dihydrofolate reductase
MGKLIYSMLTSLDGYTEDEHGEFGWGAPEDEAVHFFINELGSSFGTYLYGRRMYETMVYWETAHTVPDQPPFVLDFARQWQAADKIVYSRSLGEPRSTRAVAQARQREEVVCSFRSTLGGPHPFPTRKVSVKTPAPDAPA